MSPFDILKRVFGALMALLGLGTAAPATSASEDDLRDHLSASIKAREDDNRRSQARIEEVERERDELLEDLGKHSHPGDVLARWNERVRLRASKRPG